MINITADEWMPAAQNSDSGKTIFFFMFGIVSVMLLERID